MVTAVLLAPFALLAAWFLAGVHRRRPWDAMLFAASPALVLTGLINWDLIAVAAVAGALWAWSRGRPVLSGVLIGLGTATKLYPLFLLGALLVVCLRRRRMPDVRAGHRRRGGRRWLAVNLPAMLYDFDQWKVFWTFNDERGADLGSIWLVWQQAGHTVSPALINRVSLVFFAVGLRRGARAGAARPPYPPDPAAGATSSWSASCWSTRSTRRSTSSGCCRSSVLARPRWRDVLIWTAGEVFYFAGVWLYLGG